MIRTTLLLAATFLCSFSASAQLKPQPCGFDYLLDYYRKIDPGYQQRLEATYEASARSTAKGTAGVYKIPVVFHVIYNNANQNIHDSIIMNQLQVLNEAYRHTHKDTGKVRPLFKPLAGDAEIEFYLADRDPSGNITTGITRTQTNITMFADIYGDPTLFKALERIKNTSEGGHDPWPTDRYLNIWIADMQDITLKQAFLYGYALPPTNPLPPNWNSGLLPVAKDGVVVHYTAIGNNNPFNTGYGKEGRALVHEVGHYLGLRHIWGDAQTYTDTCVVDDGIADTPPQALQSDVSLTCMQLDNQNTCGSHLQGDLPDQWENYMDYSANECQAMFTANQITHMRSILENQRSPLRIPLAVQKPASATHSLGIYPQPASNSLTINYDGKIEQMSITDILGKKVMALNGEYANRKMYDISNIPAGNYIITLIGNGQPINKRLIISK